MLGNGDRVCAAVYAATTSIGEVGLPSAIRACARGDIVRLPRGDSSLASSALSESEKVPMTWIKIKEHRKGDTLP